MSLIYYPSNCASSMGQNWPLLRNPSTPLYKPAQLDVMRNRYSYRYDLIKKSWAYSKDDGNGWTPLTTLQDTFKYEIDKFSDYLRAAQNLTPIAIPQDSFIFGTKDDFPLTVKNNAATCLNFIMYNQSQQIAAVHKSDHDDEGWVHFSSMLKNLGFFKGVVDIYFTETGNNTTGFEDIKNKLYSNLNLVGAFGNNSLFDIKSRQEINPSVQVVPNVAEQTQETDTNQLT